MECEHHLEREQRQHENRESRESREKSRGISIVDSVKYQYWYRDFSPPDISTVAMFSIETPLSRTQSRTNVCSNWHSGWHAPSTSFRRNLMFMLYLSNV